MSIASPIWCEILPNHLALSRAHIWSPIFLVSAMGHTKTKQLCALDALLQGNAWLVTIEALSR